MTVRLISITRPGDPSIGTEELMAYCARVSNPANQDNHANASKLLRYCLRKKHWSVFEMVDVTYEIETTRDIARQLLRHRSFSFQEFSQRYAAVSMNNLVTRQARMQDTTNRQNSVDVATSDMKIEWYGRQAAVRSVVEDAYKWALDNGIAKECARVVLPEGMTPSRLYMKGSLRSWIHWIEVRDTPETQKEHRLLAEEVKLDLSDEFGFLRDYWNSAITETDR